MTDNEGDPLRRQIATELAAAQLAREEGKEGMARVSARRAAGAAIAAWDPESRSRTPDAVALLRLLESAPGIPHDVRNAAGRLISRVNPDFTPPHPEDPIDDARTIISFCLGKGAAG